MEHPSFRATSLFGGATKISEIAVVTSLTSSTGRGLLAPVPKEMWPPLTEEQRLSTYKVQKKFLEDWEEKFEERKGRKPQHEDLTSDMGMSFSRYKDFDRHHRKLFPKLGDVQRASLPFMPPEVWSMVLGYLDVDDLKSVQLVSRTWADLAWRHISENGTFSLSREFPGLERLEQLGSSDRLRQNLKSLTFKIGGSGKIPIAGLLHELSESITTPHKTKQIEAGIKEYRAWDRRKISAAQDYGDRDILRRVLQNFEGVKDLTITMDRCNWNVEELQELWFRSTPWEPTDPRSSRHRGWYHLQASKELKAILTRTKTFQLKRLRFESIPLASFAYKPLRSFTYNSGLRRNEDFIFEHLENLVAIVDPWNPGPETLSDRKIRKSVKGLFKLLKKAPNLKRLHVGLALNMNNPRDCIWMSNVPGRDWRFDLGASFNPKPWKSLTQLFLGGFAVDTTDLLQFLKSHALTLRELDLYDLRCGAPIELLLREIRNAMTGLTRFHMFGLWSSPAMRDDNGQIPVVQPCVTAINALYHMQDSDCYVEKEPTTDCKNIEDYVLRRTNRLDPYTFDEGFAEDFGKDEGAVEELAGGVEGKDDAGEKDGEGKDKQLVVYEKPKGKGSDSELVSTTLQDAGVRDDLVEETSNEHSYEIDEEMPLMMWQLNALEAETITESEGSSPVGA